jgi:hypothetical protein
MIDLSNHLQFTYGLKPGTSTSFYKQSGPEGFLPNRLGITRQKFSYINQTGKNHLEGLQGQMKGTFTKKEESIYKKFRPWWIHSSIYEITDFPGFFGYGDIGITSANKKTEGTEDLLIFLSSDEFKSVSIHLFRGMLFRKDEVFRYLYNKTRPYDRASLGYCMNDYMK